MKRLRGLILIPGTLGVIFLIVGILGVRNNLRSVLPYSTMTADQVEEGIVICGYVGVNLGAFAEEYYAGRDTWPGDSFYYYAILAGDKIMALRCHGKFQKEILDAQVAQITESPERWREVGRENATQAERMLRIQGVVSRMNSSVLECMKEYLTPEGETETIAEILPLVVDTSMTPTAVNIAYILAGVIVLVLSIVFWVRLSS